MLFCALLSIPVLLHSLVSPTAQFVTSSRANVFVPTEPSRTAEKLSSAQPHLRQLSKCNDFSHNVVCPVTAMLVSVLPIQHPTSS
jgi:hypothetical protein